MVERRKVEEEEEERERLFTLRQLGLLPPKDFVSVSEEVKEEKTEKESEERRVEEEERKSKETERMRRKAEARETRVNEIREDCKRQRLESDKKKEEEENKARKICDEKEEEEEEEERKSKELAEEQRKSEGEKDEREKEEEEKDKEEEKTEEEKERKGEGEKVEKKGGKEEGGGKMVVGWIFSEDFFWYKRMCSLDEEFWKNEYWKRVRKEIQESVPAGLLKEIYKQNFDDLRVSSNSSCPNCCNFEKVIKHWHRGLVVNSCGSFPYFFTRWLFFHDSDPDICEGDYGKVQELYFRDVSIWQDTSKTMEVWLSEYPWDAEDNLKVLQGLKEEADLSFVKFQIITTQTLSSDIFDQLLEILAQLENVEDIFFAAGLDGEQSLRLWTVLSNLSKLSRLSIRGDVLTRLENPMPLINLKSVTMVYQSSRSKKLPKLELDKIFPDVTKFIVTNTGPLGFMQKATSFDCGQESGSILLHPFCLLHRLPNARAVKARCFDYFNLDDPDDPNGLTYQHFRNFIRPQLTSLDLKLALDSSLSYAYFKMFFVSFPNLISLTLTINVEVTNFDENDFVRLLFNSQSKFANLKRLKLRFNKEAPKGMTSKSALAILRNSNLVEFCNLAYYSFTDQDLEELKVLAVERNLKIVPSFHHATGGMLTICEQGSHNWCCLEPDMDSRSFDDL